MAKFKVGDKVRNVGYACFGHMGEIGVLEKDDGSSVPYYVRFPDGDSVWFKADQLVSPAISAAKILITTDGKTTLARLYEGEKVTKSAEAKCAPSDTPDFAIGATLAFDRLMGREAEKKPENKPQKSAFDWDAFKAGKIAAHCDTREKAKAFCKEVKKRFPKESMHWEDGETSWGVYQSDTLYDLAHYGRFMYCNIGGPSHEMSKLPIIDYAISEPAPTFTVTRAQIAALGACSGGLAWFDKRHSDGEADFGKLVKEAEQDGRSGDAAWLRNREAKLKEAPKFFSGKVVCVDKGGARAWEEGTTYTFENGRCTNSLGGISPYSEEWVTSIEHMNRIFSPSRFLEYKGEARHE